MKKSLLFLSLIASLSINAQWTSQATGFTETSRGLSEIRIVDANTVWAIAYDGSGLGADIQEFTRTSNGGTLWTPGLIDVGNPALRITNISPVSADVAWVGTFDEVDGFGGVFKTSDGGASWEPQNAAAYTTPGESWFNVVHFFDANIGITQGDPENGEYEIYRTTDGGTTWTRIPGAALPNPLAGEYGYNGGYAFSGDSLWFTTNKGRLIRTTDKGVTWAAYQAPLTDFGSAAQSGSVDFSSPTNGGLLKTIGTTYTWYTTTNGGQTWSAGAPFTGTRRILSYVPGTTTIVATSAAAPVGTSVSVDNGTTWTDVESAEQRGASAFLNMTTGWAAGFSFDEFTDGVYKLTGTLGTQNVEATAKFKVYPNPATSTVTISTTDVDTYNLSVTDLSGKVVMTKSLNGIENTLDISALATGAYFFELNANNKKEVVKILKN
jgi:photosystem II stability/assembly factor-like uncharacterized protein